jgi:hypothetical protein
MRVGCFFGHFAEINLSGRDIVNSVRWKMSSRLGLYVLAVLGGCPCEMADIGAGGATLALARPTTDPSSPRIPICSGGEEDEKKAFCYF